MQFLNRSIFLCLLFLISPAAQAQVRSELQLFSDSFVSSSFAATEKTDYQFFGAHLKTDEGTEQALRMDISGAIAFGAPLLNYLNVAEFYHLQNLPDQQTLTLGRKRFLWSELDSHWDLGLWEPVFKWNPLSPSSQGLSGLFWEVQRSQLSVMIFASPLYLPDQGPSYEIENGQFIRGNPWFRRPPETLRIFNETTDIEYNVQRPEETDIIMQSSYGGRLSFGDQKKWLVQMSYVYKPANQLALGYDGVLDLAKDKGTVDVMPAIFYHSLIGFDATYRTGPIKWGVSVSNDRPTNERLFDEKWTTPVFSDATLFSPFVELLIGRHLITFQHLEVSGGEVKEQGELADPSRRPLTTRYQYRSAQQLSLQSQMSFTKSRSLQTKLAYILSQKEGYEVVRASARAHLSRLWSFYGELQFVKLQDELLSSQSEIGQYANNDRFMLGVSYVF